MQIIDTHTHLYLNQFKEDIDDVIVRAKEIGVKKFIFPAIESSHFDSMHSLKNKYPDNIYLMSGLHPTDVNENYKDELDFVVNSLKTNNYVAIGEIGIDLYWDKSFLKQQQEAFKFQIRLAIEHDLPIVIHCRVYLIHYIRAHNRCKLTDLIGELEMKFIGKIKDCDVMFLCLGHGKTTYAFN